MKKATDGGATGAKDTVEGDWGFRHVAPSYLRHSRTTTSPIASVATSACLLL